MKKGSHYDCPIFRWHNPISDELHPCIARFLFGRQYKYKQIFCCAKKMFIFVKKICKQYENNNYIS